MYIKIITLSLLCSSLSGYAQILQHSKEIGLYQTNKQTVFIKDLDMLSPKSAEFINGRLFINALEKGETLSYNVNTWTKEKSIRHSFDKPKFAEIPNFTYAISNQAFMGKPVEIAHNASTMWIPYYRLSWDYNSRHGSAIAQVNLADMSIESILPSGSIPKMVAVTRDNKVLASTHWGDNTVGLYQLHNNKVVNYDYVVVGNKLNIDNISGDRDRNCGFCLRGTVFTADDKYLLVGKMGGGGIAVIDVAAKSYVGTISNVPSTPRHLVLNKAGDMLYVSTVASGEVAKIKMATVYQAIDDLKAQRKVNLSLNDWQRLKMGSGVRTLALSQDEKYIYAALNNSSELGVVDNASMTVLEKYKIASFPVGMAVSPDDRYIAVTSQGKEGLGGGNHVDIFERKKRDTRLALVR